MSNIKDIFAERGTSPYAKPVKVKVVARGDIVTYRNNDGEDRQCLNCAVTDNERLVKCVAYDVSKFSKLAVNNTVVLRDIIKKTDGEVPTFVVTKTTKVFLTTTLEVDPDWTRKGEELINPPPAAKTTLERALRSPQKTKVSVTGRVVQEDAVRGVKVRGQDVAIKTIYLADDTTERCQVTLWRDAAETDLRTGEHVTITDVTTNSYRNEISLSATNRTTIEKVEAPLTSAHLVIVGISVEGNSVDLLVDDDSVVTMKSELLNQASPDTEDLESITEGGPVTIKVERRGGEVVSLEIF